MWPLTLREVAEAIGVDLPRACDPDAAVSGATFGERTVTTEDVFFAIRHEGIDAHAYTRSALAAGAPLAVVAHGVDPRCVTVAEPLVAYRALAAALRKKMTCPVIAIIGAAGKTTTKEMVARALLNAGLAVAKTPGTDNGWVGIPRTIHASAHLPLDALVVEVGIDAPHAMAHHRELLRPTLVVVPSLGAEHLAGLLSGEQAIAEELVMADGAPRIWNGNDPETKARLDGLRAPQDIVVTSGETMNEWNAALAIATARAVGIEGPTLDGLEMPRLRREERTLNDGARVILDAFNANPVSVRAALREFALEGAPNKVLILGDMLDLGASTSASHAALASEIRAIRGAHVRLIGEAMRALKDELVRDRGALATVAEASIETALDGLTLDKDTSVLIKASRGMRLERILSTRPRTQAREPWPAPPPFAKEILTVGITGTKGKTTTTTFVAAALGSPVISATTLGYFIDRERLDLPLDFDSFLEAMRLGHARGARHAAIEVTSQALAHGFARAWPCAIGCFTNLSHDHLDVHHSPEHYLASKAQLFAALPPGGTAILNAADPASALLEEIIPKGVAIVRYALGDLPDADLTAAILDVTWSGTRIRLESTEVTLTAIGAPFVEDALAAMLAGIAAGQSREDVVRRVAKAQPPEGRFQLVAREPFVVVDYAHAPDALARVTQTARGLSKGRTIVVFGAGGDRDREKRPEMGRAVREADIVIITNDNPRREDPWMIAEHVRFGLSDHPHVEVELDRARAIGRAIELADREDVVLIAGKGHERIQTIGAEERPFSDVDVARAAHAGK